MKKLMFFFVAFIFFSCSKEEEPEKEPEEKAWHVSITGACGPYDNKDLITYCISQSVYNTIYMRIRNNANGDCLWIDDLEDLENNVIQGSVKELGTSRCTTTN